MQARRSAWKGGCTEYFNPHLSRSIGSLAFDCVCAPSVQLSPLVFASPLRSALLRVHSFSTMSSGATSQSFATNERNAVRAGGAPTAVKPADDSDSDDEAGGLAMEALFTNRSYELQTQHWPGASLNFFALKQNVTDADLTGQVVWPGTELMARFLLCPLQHFQQRAPAIAKQIAQLLPTIQPQPTASGENGNTECGRCAGGDSSAAASSSAAVGASLTTASTSSLAVEPVPSTDVHSLPAVPPTSLGCLLLHGRATLELGSGCGLLVLLLRRFASLTCATDHNSEVLALLQRNKQHDEQRRNDEDGDDDGDVIADDDLHSSIDYKPHAHRRHRGELSVERVEWGEDRELPRLTPNEGSNTTSTLTSCSCKDWDVLIGADVCYGPTAMALLFATVSRYFRTRNSHAIFLCSFPTRWTTVDRAIDAALETHKELRCIRVPLDAFVPQPLESFKHGNMLIFYKKRTNAE